MNNRILQLAASHFPRDGEGNICATPEIIAEFAELIVRECAKVAGQEQVYNERHEIPVDIEHSVLEHFGVE